MSARIELLGLTIDPLNLEQAVHQVLSWAAREDGAGCRYVVTPNVDHVVLLQQNAALRAAYETAGLILADGAPVIWASRLLGTPLPERVAGSDLVPALFEAADAKQPVSVFLLGAAPGVGDKAAQAIQRRWPGVRVVGTYSPPLGFERDEAENRAILARVEAASTSIIGKFAPKRPCASVRRSIFSREKSPALQLGCGNWGWSGCIGWRVSPAAWPPATPAMPGSFPNSSPAPGGTCRERPARKHCNCAGGRSIGYDG